MSDALHQAADEIFAAFPRQVLPFALAAATAYADVVAGRERDGSPIGGFDAQIAAICRSQAAVLATRNTKAFTDIGSPSSIRGRSPKTAPSSVETPVRHQLSPKRLARTYRFAATVFAINPAGPIDWGDRAGGAGCFDQARFGHEFRAFTGLTPTRYVEVRRRFLREHPGHVLDSWPLPAD